jgi:ElaB/YqjD/DUF883 family membrane-anchored ribosome-binding protein
MVFYVLYKYAMDLPGSPKEIIDEVVSKVEEAVPELISKAEELLPEVVDKIKDVLPEVSEKIEDAVKNIDNLANDALSSMIERVPQVARAVEIVDEALAGVAYSCGLFGWILSVSRAHRSPAKSEALSSEAPK